MGGETLVATLFDLARRGHLQIQEEEPSSAKARRKKQNDYFFGVNKKRSTELRPFERDLLDFMTQRASDRTGFRISDLKRVAKKSRSTFVKWFERWKKLFKEEATQLNIFEPYPVGPMVSNIFLGLLGIIVGIGACVGTSSPAGLPALIPGALQIAFTGLLSRRTRAGERLFQEWSAFRSRIKKGDQTHLRLSQEWDAALIGTVSLGLIKPFNRLLERADQNVVTAPWFMALHGDSGGLTSMSSSIQSMVSTVSSTSASTAASAGAAASGGGGGGAG